MKTNKYLFTLLLLLAPNVSQGQAAWYHTKNTATRFCGTVMNATTSKVIGAAATGADCEYAVVLDGTSEAAYTDLATAEVVVGSVGQFCAPITPGEINIDGDLRIKCTFTNTNANDVLATFTTRGGKVEAGGIGATSVADGALTRTKFASDGTAQNSSTTTAVVLASTDDYPDNALVNRIICFTSAGTNGVKGLCRYITANVASTDTVTVAALPVEPDAAEYFVGGFNDKTGYSLGATQAFNNTGTWTGGVTGAVGSVTGNVGGNVVGTVASLASVTNIATAIFGATTAELAACPNTYASATFADKVNFVFTALRNKYTETATSRVLFKDDQTATLCSNTVSDNGTVATITESN